MNFHHSNRIETRDSSLLLTQYRMGDPRRFQKAISIFQSIQRRAVGLNAVET
jgi:hypothetical protein